MPENHPRIIAAAQATVDFYEQLRGRPSQWTEIDYAEAEAALQAADAWDAAHGVHRIPLNDELRDRLADAIHGAGPNASSQAILTAVLSALDVEDSEQPSR